MNFLKKLKSNFFNEKRYIADIYIKIGCALSIIISLLILVTWISLPALPILSKLNNLFSDKLWNTFTLIILIILNIANILFNVQVILGTRENKNFAILSTIIIGGIFPILFIIFGKYEPIDK